MSKMRLDIKEYDEAGNLIATYIQSTSKRFDGDAARVDVVVSSLKFPFEVFQRQLARYITHTMRNSFQIIRKQYGTSVWTCFCRPGTPKVLQMTI
jgi:hypothetical protein